ncbi:hypothetical protein CDAR_32901 [Caerostris darwini]|uniref:Uncharacterized protein n=1 Tax=Caerostris darwini TaxID=1538125 RepID=A0AAV4SJP6_9ARAC|nr:hypothetical protein CDAR_32901 [Caerostris darwini]
MVSRATKPLSDSKSTPAAAPPRLLHQRTPLSNSNPPLSSSLKFSCPPHHGGVSISNAPRDTNRYLCGPNFWLGPMSMKRDHSERWEWVQNSLLKRQDSVFCPALSILNFPPP